MADLLQKAIAGLW